LAGRWLDPYSPQRLMAVSAAVSAMAMAVAWLALRGLEGAPTAAAPAPQRPDFRSALREVWGEPDARRFTIFVFVSMVAYSTQDLILEPFAGTLFGFTPGESTQMAGVQHGGTLAGMLLAALAGRRVAGAALGSLRAWTIGGCLASALALMGLVLAGLWAPHWPLRANVFVLGLANGAFSIAAIGSMMSLASAGRGGREGTRMGLWGAAQAIGFALGGLFGAAASDLARWLLGQPSLAYASVFLLEAAMFVAAAALAARIAVPAPTSHATELQAVGELPGLTIGGTR
jgi:BCD family chlorophyll transporter-like MFS transporter